LEQFAIINVAHGQEMREVGTDEDAKSVYNVTEAALAIWFVCQIEVSSRFAVHSHACAATAIAVISANCIMS